MAAGFVHTVLGSIEPDRLGITQPHEHLLIDLVGPTRPSAQTEEELRRWDEPITLQNYYEVRRHIRRFRENLQLTGIDDAIDEVGAFVRAGGSSIADLTTIDLGRDPLALQSISRAAGVNIVMGTAYYVHDFHPPEIAEMSEGQIAEILIRDLTEGTPSGVRAGIIGEIGMSWPHHPDEIKILRAAVLAQLSTGAPLSIHPGRDASAPAAAMDEVERMGGDPTRTAVGHIDRTLTRLEDILDLANRGCYVELDLFGQESSYYDLSPIDMPNDAIRIDIVMSLIEHGRLRQLLVSQDVCRKAHLQRFGGEGYGHLLSRVLPMMRRKGMGQSEIDEVIIANPARFLTIVDRSA